MNPFNRRCPLFLAPGETAFLRGDPEGMRFLLLHSALGVFCGHLIGFFHVPTLELNEKCKALNEWIRRVFPSSTKSARPYSRCQKRIGVYCYAPGLLPTCSTAAAVVSSEVTALQHPFCRLCCACSADAFGQLVDTICGPLHATD